MRLYVMRRCRAVILCAAFSAMACHRPSLLEAAAAGDVRSVRAALQRGEHVEVGDRAGNTPLIAAAGSGNVEVVRSLLRAGARVNARNSDGDTPLLKAVGPHGDRAIA